MFEISNQWFSFALDISTKSLLLAVAVWVFIKLANIRDASVRHRIWSCVLLAMLTLPLLTSLLPTIPVSIPARFVATSAPIVETQLNQSESAATQDFPTPDRPGLPASSSEEFPSTAQDTAITAITTPGPTPDTTSTTRHLASLSDAQDETAISQTPIETRFEWQGPASILLFVAWSCMCGFFGLRLLAGLWFGKRLLQRATIVNDEIRSQLSFPQSISVNIRESSETCVPVTVGWFQPTVLFPMDWRSWSEEKLEAITTHELTHVARRDFLVALCAELNNCLYWFHPVAWWLRKQLSDLAETACDDAAIGKTGDRTGYARHVLEVAAQVAQSSGRIVQPGLAMARESNVETRISAILDSDRPLSERISWKAAAFIALIMIPAIGAAAAIRTVPADESNSAQTSVQSTSETDAETDAETDDQKEDSGPVHLFGKVVSPDGKAIPNAEVSFYLYIPPAYYASSSQHKLVTKFSTDQEGRFDKTISSKPFLDWEKVRAKQRKSGPIATMVVSAPGFADKFFHCRSNTFSIKGGVGSISRRWFSHPGFLDREKTIKVSDDEVASAGLRDEEISIKLRRPVPIDGRLLTNEGEPVVGASVSVLKTVQHDPQRIEKWISQTSPKPIKIDPMMMTGSPKADSYFPSLDGHGSEFNDQSTTTDNQGRFRFDELIGKNDAAVLRIRGKSIADHVIHVIGRDMKKPIYGKHLTNFTDQGAYYGQSFDHVTQLSVPVFGIVRDLETKEPLPNVLVATSSIFGRRMTQTGYLLTRTDEQGRYRIEGLPVAPSGARGSQLLVCPGNVPYAENKFLKVPNGDGKNPIEFNLELRRAVMAKGRITEKGTGKPLQAEIYYVPFATNENCDKYAAYSSRTITMFGNSSNYHSDENGNFQIPVIPGRGVIAAIVRDSTYVKSYGADEIEELSNNKQTIGVFKYGHIIPSHYHSLKEINVAQQDAKEIEVSLETDPGISVEVQFVGPNGEPLEDVQGSGFAERWKKSIPSTSKIGGLVLEKTHPIYALSKDRTLARFARIIPNEGEPLVKIQLYPKSKIVGRLVDNEGRPLDGIWIETNHQNDPDIGSSLTTVATDEEGRFEINAPVGVSYSINVQAEKYFRLVKDLEVMEPKLIDLGDFTVDEDAENWAMVEAKHKPVITDLE